MTTRRRPQSLLINLDELTPLEVAMLKTDLESFRDDRANEHYRVAEICWLVPVVRMQ